MECTVWGVVSILSVGVFKCRLDDGMVECCRTGGWAKTRLNFKTASNAESLMHTGLTKVAYYSSLTTSWPGNPKTDIFYTLCILCC